MIQAVVTGMIGKGDSWRIIYDEKADPDTHPFLLSFLHIEGSPEPGSPTIPPVAVNLYLSHDQVLEMISDLNGALLTESLREEAGGDA